MRVLNQVPTLTLLVVLAFGVTPPPALAASPSGKAIAVIQSTDILSGGNQHGLVPEAPVYMGDRVITDTGGEAQIQFVDDTRLVVGPGSSLVIDKFVFKGQTASNVTINAVRGTFRFITGNSPKNAYLIRTPTATLGLRGTALDVTIANGETRVALYGEPNKIGIRICDRNRRNCIDMKDRCDLVVVKRGGSIERPQSTERAQILKTSFPYLKSQESLWSKFRLEPVGCGVSTATFSNPNEGWAPTFEAPTTTPDGPPVCGPGEYSFSWSHGPSTDGPSNFSARGSHFGGPGPVSFGGLASFGPPGPPGFGPPGPASFGPPSLGPASGGPLGLGHPGGGPPTFGPPAGGPLGFGHGPPTFGPPGGESPGDGPSPST